MFTEIDIPDVGVVPLPAGQYSDVEDIVADFGPIYPQLDNATHTTRGTRVVFNRPAGVAKA